MSEGNFEDTHPISVIQKPESEERPKRSPWWLRVVIGVIGLIIVAGIGAFGGYRSGIQQRIDLESTELAFKVQEQFELGVQDLEAGRFDIARQRFEFVIQNDPDYPGVTELLAQTLLELNTTATATPVPTPTLTPTPDLRDAEDLFFQAEGLLASGEWSQALETLDTLRKKQPDFMAVAVDGMYYVALRNRGVEQIQGGFLEVGMYDLSRAELFGPLDRDAQAWRSWARLYVNGASYWEVNWAQAIAFFSELALAAPNLRDQANWTATERLRIALIRFGDQFAQAEDWCSAREQYDAALAMQPDLTLEPTATHVAEACFTPTPKPKPPTEIPEATATPEVSPILTESPPTAPPASPTAEPPRGATPTPEETPTSSG